MTNTIRDNFKFYMPLVTLLCSFTYFLNHCTKIHSCAFAFTLLALTVNVITELFSRNKALKTVTLAIIVSILLSWNLVYFIQSEPISGMVLMSLLSVFVGAQIATKLITALSPRIGFNRANFCGLISFAVVDASLMAMFFMNKFAFAKVVEIFLKEVGFKTLYAGIIFAVILIAQKIIGNVKNKELANAR